jgi:hypothetical protein
MGMGNDNEVEEEARDTMVFAVAGMSLILEIRFAMACGIRNGNGNETGKGSQLRWVCNNRILPGSYGS